MTRATVRDAVGALVLTAAAGVELLLRSDVVVDPFAVMQVVVVCAALAGRRDGGPHRRPRPWWPPRAC